jgi:Tol biopolymer transport system component
MGGRYLPSGQLLYFWAGNLLLSSLNLATGVETAPPVTVIPGVTRDGWVGAQVSTSQNGSMVYLNGPPYLDRSLIWVDSKGNQSPLHAPPGPWDPLDISRDGKLLLLTKPEIFDHTWSLWTLDLSSGAWRKIAEGGHGRTTAVFSSDGARVIFTSDRDGGEFVNLHSIQLNGDFGSERRLAPRSNFGQFPQSFSACGDLVYLEGVHPATNTEIWVMPPGGAPRLFLGGGGWKRHPAFSPDCHWLAYVSDVPSPGTIYVQPYPGPGPPVAIAQGDAPIWMPNGAGLYYRTGDRTMRIPIQLREPLQPGIPERLFESVFVHPETWTSHRLLAPDGRFLMMKGKSEYDSLRKIHVVLNWEGELKHAGPPAILQSPLLR